MTPEQRLPCQNPRPWVTTRGETNNGSERCWECNNCAVLAVVHNAFAARDHSYAERVRLIEKLNRALSERDMWCERALELERRLNEVD